MRRWEGRLGALIAGLLLGGVLWGYANTFYEGLLGIGIGWLICIECKEKIKNANA